MIVCYADGGGLGHLTRIRAYLHTRSPRGGPVTILTGSRFAADPRVVGGCDVRSAPSGLDRDALSRWLAAHPGRAGSRGTRRGRLSRRAVRRADRRTVPGGTRAVHLARLLRWDTYRPLLPAEPLRFAETFAVEPLTGEHEEYLRSVSASLTPLEPAEPPAEPADAGASAPCGWLIVHSGPPDETAELVAYARDIADLEGVRPRFTLVSPIRPRGLPPDVAHLDVYPAWPLFPYAERIVTAAGCNAVRQLAPWADRHRVLPFPRRFDDQFTRAARVRERQGNRKPGSGDPGHTQRPPEGVPR